MGFKWQIFSFSFSAKFRLNWEQISIYSHNTINWGSHSDTTQKQCIMKPQCINELGWQKCFPPLCTVLVDPKHTIRFWTESWFRYSDYLTGLRICLNPQIDLIGVEEDQLKRLWNNHDVESCVELPDGCSLVHKQWQAFSSNKQSFTENNCTADINHSFHPDLFLPWFNRSPIANINVINWSWVSNPVDLLSINL